MKDLTPNTMLAFCFTKILKTGGIWRVKKSARQQNRSFLPFCPQRTPILTIAYGSEYLCGSLRVQWRSSSTPLEQKDSRLYALKRERGTVSLYLHHPAPRLVPRLCPQKVIYPLKLIKDFILNSNINTVEF